MRKLNALVDFVETANGSVLYSCGKTIVLCNVKIEEKVPNFLKKEKKGWLFAEYQMLPSSTLIRTQRESTRGRLTGRTVEISRLIGRVFRSVIDLKKIPNITLSIDCDVLSADGSTRVAAINGGMIALKIAIDKLLLNGKINENPIKYFIGAVSVGKVNNETVFDLNYEQDNIAECDINIIMNENKDIIEISGGAEESLYSKDDLFSFVNEAESCIEKIICFQKGVINERNTNSK